MAKSNCSRRDEDGFSLIEVTIATGLFITALAALAQMFVIASQSNLRAKTTTFATALAQQKMEQLRSLSWGYDSLGLPVSDITTDTTVTPERPTGGTGLAPSPEGTLLSNVAGYVDYLDVNGNSLGGGTNVPAGTAYIRRWSIEPLPTNPNNTLILQVLVIRPGMNVAQSPAAGTTVAQGPDRAQLVSVKTRKTI